MMRKKGSANITIGVAMVTAVALKPVLVSYNRRAGVDGRRKILRGSCGADPSWDAALIPKDTGILLMRKLGRV